MSLTMARRTTAVHDDDGCDQPTDARAGMKCPLRGLTVSKTSHTAAAAGLAQPWSSGDDDRHVPAAADHRHRPRRHRGNDLDEAIDFYRENFGFGLVHQEANAEQGVREAMVAVGTRGRSCNCSPR